MAAGRWSIRIEGLGEIVHKLDPDVLYRNAVKRFFDRTGSMVTSRAKRMTPVDTGRLRASLTYQVERRPMPRYVEVGSNVNYAIYVHEGTSKMRGRPFIRRAINQARGTIRGYMRDAAREIERKWQR